MKRFLPYIILAICLLPQFFVRCANSSRAPAGGPKDSLAPVLIGRFPENKAVGFNGKQVSFAFNEYVQLKDQNKQFVMSPPIEKKPVLKIKGRQVVVTFPSELQPNTTYYLDFGTSVVDLNEGNPAEYLSTVFSTGSSIDSLVFAGRLVDAFTLEPVDGSFMFLYEDNIDSIPYLKNPNAMARSDKDGVFLIKGLKHLDYKIFGVEDKNSNYKYDAGSELIAFSDILVRPLSLTDNDSLSYDNLPVFKMFSENVRKQFLGSYKQTEKRQIELVFNQINPQINKFDVEGLTSDNFIIEHSRWNDTIKYWIKAENVPDTLKATIEYLKTDSINQLSPSEAKLKFELDKKGKDENVDSDKSKDTEEKKAKKKLIAIDISADARKVIESNVRVSFKAPLIKCNPSLFILYKYNDAGDKKDEIKFNWNQDTLHVREYTLNANWETATKYELKILPNAVVDVYGLSNDTIVKTIETANPDKFSSIVVTLNNTNGSYIIQLVKNKKEIVAQKFAHKDGNVTFAYLDAAKYQIRIIEDRNDNKVWDAGLYLKHLHPERVAFVKKEDGTLEFDLRPSWELLQTVDINKIFKLGDE